MTAIAISAPSNVGIIYLAYHLNKKMKGNQILLLLFLI